MFEASCQPYYSRAFLQNKIRNNLRYLGIEDWAMTKVFGVIINLNKFS